MSLHYIIYIQYMRERAYSTHPHMHAPTALQGMFVLGFVYCVKRAAGRVHVYYIYIYIYQIHRYICLYVCFMCIYIYTRFLRIQCFCIFGFKVPVPSVSLGTCLTSVRWCASVAPRAPGPSSSRRWWRTLRHGASRHSEGGAVGRGGRCCTSSDYKGPPVGLLPTFLGGGFFY